MRYGRSSHVLEQQDRAARVDLPGVPSSRPRSVRLPPTRRPSARPARDAAGPRSGAARRARERCDQRAASRRDRASPPRSSIGPWKPTEPGAAPLPEQQRRDVAVADQRLARGAERAPDRAGRGCGRSRSRRARTRSRRRARSATSSDQLGGAARVVAREIAAPREQVVAVHDAEAGARATARPAASSSGSTGPPGAAMPIVAPGAQRARLDAAAAASDRRSDVERVRRSRRRVVAKPPAAPSPGAPPKPGSPTAELAAALAGEVAEARVLARRTGA